MRWTLENLTDDPSMIRAYLAFELARSISLPAPHPQFVQVEINGKSRGTYLMVQSADDLEYLSRHFGSADGALFEGEMGCDLQIGKTDCFDQERGDNDAKRHLVKLVDRIASGRFWSDPKPPFAFDHLAASLAFGTYIGDFDGYVHAHNYRLFLRNSDNTWWFITSGLDRTFMQAVAPFAGTGVLSKLCFDHQPCRAAYLQALRQLDRVAQTVDVTALAMSGGILQPKIADIQTFLANQHIEMNKLMAAQSDNKAPP
jgi:hypothetical protein